MGGALFGTEGQGWVTKCHYLGATELTVGIHMPWGSGSDTHAMGIR